MTYAGYNKIYPRAVFDFYGIFEVLFICLEYFIKC